MIKLVCLILLFITGIILGFGLHYEISKPDNDYCFMNCGGVKFVENKTLYPYHEMCYKACMRSEGE